MSGDQGVDAGGVVGVGASPTDCEVVFFIVAAGGGGVGLVAVVSSDGIGLLSFGKFVSVGAAVVCVVDGISVDGAAPVAAHATARAEIANNGMSFFMLFSFSNLLVSAVTGVGFRRVVGAFRPAFDFSLERDREHQCFLGHANGSADDLQSERFDWR